ncbi:hypothetical protein [Streptomyces sp. CC208A]|uniref:hypothetical protein n=1 Tax=Streptomyces sp. CC208A TaxID=3044573 RepID=UPI0024A8F8EE|nr:hypothetical protein [Streptomyces sp. CC208A]
MQGTRTPAQLLAGAAVAAALTGCMAVDGPPPVPAPAPAPTAEPVRPAQDVEPQIVLQGPAREALEAALPSPAPTAVPPRGETRRATGDAAPSRTPAPTRTATVPEPSAAPEPSPVPDRPPALPRARARAEVPRPFVPEVHKPERAAGRPEEAPPVTGADVCELGERYGAWKSGSARAELCQGASERH